MKKNKNILITAAFLVGAALLLGGCGEDESVDEITEPVTLSPEEAKEAASHWYDVDSEYHADVDYADMEMSDVDEEAIKTAISGLRQYAETETDEQTVRDAVDALNAAMDDMATQEALCQISHYANFNDQELADRESELSEMFTDYSDQCYSLLRDVLNGPNGDALKAYIDDDELVEGLLDYEDMTDREKEVQKEITDLQLEYDTASIQDVVIDGKAWNEDSLSSAYENGDISAGEYQTLITEFYKEYNSRICEIYLRMIPVLNESAVLEGYENFADSAYDDYNRDYTYEDLQTVYSGVKDYVVPLMEDIDNGLSYNEDLMDMNLSGEERIERVGRILGSIDPGLLDAWDYFTGHHLYDLDANENKGDSGFTLSIYGYGAPFIFDSPYEYYEDVYTVVHEFGHYNEAYHNTGHVLYDTTNMDVAEIHSQGLEVLSFKYADELFGEDNGSDARAYKLSSLLSATVAACMYDEFQNEVFAYDGELDTETLNRMFAEISKEYGQDYYGTDEECYSWVRVPHTFSSPMYYISYGTSALAALDILAMSTEDYQSAVDCYMNLTTYGRTTEYRELLKDVGLPDVFEEGTIEDICIAVGDYNDSELSSDDDYIYLLIIWFILKSVLGVAELIAWVVLLFKFSRKDLSGIYSGGQYVPAKDAEADIYQNWYQTGGF